MSTITNILRPQNYNTVTGVFDVYVTDEENYIPYISEYNSATQTTTETEEDSQIDLTQRTFTLHQGEIKETKTFTNITSIEWNKDYEGISGEATIKIPYNKDYLKYIYKGVRCCIKTNRYDQDKNILSQTFTPATKQLEDNEHNDDNYQYTEVTQSTYNPYTDSMLGFITEVTFDTAGINIKVSAMEKLLEQTVNLEFTQLYRSHIIAEVIKIAGLKPAVDVTGLKDEIIDFTSVSKNESEDDSAGDANLADGDWNDSAMTYSLCCAHGLSLSTLNSVTPDDKYCKGIASKDRNYYKWAREQGTAKKVIKGLRSMFSYRGYSDNEDANADVTFNNGNGISCNCGDAARLTKACLDSIGIKNAIGHGGIYGVGHYFGYIYYKGEWKNVDLCYSSKMGANPGTNSLGF